MERLVPAFWELDFVSRSSCVRLYEMGRAASSQSMAVRTDETVGAKSLKYCAVSIFINGLKNKSGGRSGQPGRAAILGGFVCQFDTSQSHQREESQLRKCLHMIQL